MNKTFFKVRWICIIILYINTIKNGNAQIYYNCYIEGLGNITLNKVSADSTITKDDPVRHHNGLSIKNKWKLNYGDSNVTILKYYNYKNPSFQIYDTLKILKITYYKPFIFIFSAIPTGDYCYTYKLNIVKVESNGKCRQTQDFLLFSQDFYEHYMFETFSIIEDKNNKILQAYCKTVNKYFDMAFFVNLDKIDATENKLKLDKSIKDDKFIIFTEESKDIKHKIATQLWNKVLIINVKSADVLIFDEKLFIYSICTKVENKIAIYTKKSNNWEIYNIERYKRPLQFPNIEAWK